jgi:hypothetical protein
MLELGITTSSHISEFRVSNNFRLQDLKHAVQQGKPDSQIEVEEFVYWVFSGDFDIA